MIWSYNNRGHSTSTIRPWPSVGSVQRACVDLVLMITPVALRSGHQQKCHSCKGSFRTTSHSSIHSDFKRFLSSKCRWRLYQHTTMCIARQSILLHRYLIALLQGADQKLARATPSPALLLILLSDLYLLTQLWPTGHWSVLWSRCSVDLIPIPLSLTCRH